MKWFKHYTNAHKGDVLQVLSEEFGKVRAYAWYFLMVEYFADKWDGHSEPKFKVSMNVLCSFVGAKPNVLRTFLERLQNQTQMSFEEDSNVIEIKWPKLAEILHRDSIPAGFRPARIRPESGLYLDKKRIDNTIAKQARPTKRQQQPLPTSVEFKNFVEMTNALSQDFRSSLLDKYELTWLENQAEECFSYYVHQFPDKKPKTVRGWTSALGGWLRRAKVPVMRGESSIDKSLTCGVAKSHGIQVGKRNIWD